MSNESRKHKIFTKAPKEKIDIAMTTATRWYNEESQTMFNNTRSTAIGAVAEFILNENGFTSFDCSARKSKNITINI